MKELLINMGHLLDLKHLNRDEVAEYLGMTRQNLIASLKGRRPLPRQYMPHLTKLLQLDSAYVLKKDHVHTFSISNATKQYNACYNVIHTFLHHPIKQVALLHSIGETKSGFAYILQDKRGIYVILCNDEKTLSYVDVNNTPEKLGDQNPLRLFDYSDYECEREITLAHFERIMREGVTVEEFESILKQCVKIWTWARIREKAESVGLSPSEIATKLNLDK